MDTRISNDDNILIVFGIQYKYDEIKNARTNVKDDNNDTDEYEISFFETSPCCGNVTKDNIGYFVGLNASKFTLYDFSQIDEDRLKKDIEKYCETYGIPYSDKRVDLRYATYKCSKETCNS